MMITLKRANILLIWLIILVNAYTILAPVEPAISYWWKRRFTHSFTHLSVALDPQTSKYPIPDDNRVVIPSMLLDEHIYEGASPTIVDKGIWRRPQTSTPDKGSNTVLIGHRYIYGGDGGALYHLDTVKVGDEIALYWQKKRYIYKVDTVKIVPPTEISVEAATDKPQLTIYTCTPLWTATSRLVVIAKLEGTP